MKYIPLLLSVIFLTGCAASMSELITEAKECTKTSINPQGVIGKPTGEQSGACWEKVNNKVEANAKREAEAEAAAAGRCPRGTTKWCKSRVPGPQRCSCVRNEDARRALDELLGRQY